MKEVLLVTIDKLISDGYIDKNVDSNIIRNAVKYIQDSVVYNTIGKCIFNKLIELALCGDIDCKEYCCWKELKEIYIAPILIYGAQSEISIPLTYKTHQVGVKQISDDRIQSSGLSEIKAISRYYKDKMDFYVGRCIDFIKCNECFNCCDCGCCSHYENKGSRQPSIPISLTNIRKPYRI